MPKSFGDSAKPLLEVCRSAETGIWALAALILKPEQAEELRRGIAAWFKSHPVTGNVVAARSVGFAAEVTGEDKEASAKPGSVFNFLSLDPLGGLDPAVREMTQARLFAERALYVAHGCRG